MIAVVISTDRELGRVRTFPTVELATAYADGCFEGGRDPRDIHVLPQDEAAMCARLSPDEVAKVRAEIAKAEPAFSARPEPRDLKRLGGAPEGFRQIGAIYVSTDPAISPQIAITGMPPREPDDAEESAHNCDAMGCGQDHVVFRADSAKVPFIYLLPELGAQVLALVANNKR